MVEYFNRWVIPAYPPLQSNFSRRYAYIEIGKADLRNVTVQCSLSVLALYGKPYVSAARDTWKLFMDRGIDALVNDSLVGISKFRIFINETYVNSLL